MADSRRFAVNPQLDIAQILHEAKTRWLRPSEICEILRNYQRFKLTPDPPYKPFGGSLFLFDRKALRYFRKDGHNWRKKRDGKTVREAHEKLKCGSVDVLHCYYAHGEDNENFQRRSYWMLDGQLEHIVLVHYRDVNEGGRPTFSQISSTGPIRVSHSEGPQASTSSQFNPSTFSSQTSNVSSRSAADLSGQAPSSDFDDADSGQEFGCNKSILHLYQRDIPDAAVSSRLFDPLFSNQIPLQSLLFSAEQQKDNGTSQGSISGPSTDCHPVESKFPNLLSMSREDNFLPNVHSQIFIDVKRGNQVKQENVESVNRLKDEHLISETTSIYPETKEQLSHTALHFRSDRGIADNDHPLEYEEVSYAFKNKLETNSLDNEHENLKRLDSFGRWMSKEIGKDCDDSLMASDSGDYWNALDTQGDDKEVTSLSRHMQLDIVALGPSLSQEQLFSILDFSPDWAYSRIGTKVLISGSFLGSVDPRSIKWSCMFGEHEVSAEFVTTSVLRCQAPVHAPGRVPFYVTCSNRLACSEIREFEYRETSFSSLVTRNEQEDEFLLQVRLARLLSVGLDRKSLVCSLENSHKCNIEKKLVSMLKGNEADLFKIEKDSKADRVYIRNARDKLIQNLFKDKLYVWLVCKAHEEGRGTNVLDEEGQGAIHLAAALGYEWAVAPIIVSGVNPSFRDARGRTGLHWAAYYGREETVAALVNLGADPGAVEDPTSKFPQGQTAADLASIRGHKGIAGYLAEAHLTSHLSSLVLKESAMDSISASLASEKAVEAVQESSIAALGGSNGEQLSLRGSLAAIRNSAQAAARIQAAFRVHSFRQRQLMESKHEDTENLAEVFVLSSLSNKPQKLSHFNESLHGAAIKIQQKYRGWKGRKEFLKIRNKIVKIQAHVRGHQVRKQYRKVVWSVSIVEKAILRWRRKGAGLRGFRAAKVTDIEQEAAKTDEYEFLRLGRKQKEAGIEKALARVQSMARYPEARDQYMRLVACSSKSKLGDGETSLQVQSHGEEKKLDEDQSAPMLD
ncbi:calmodulin-binding transcription activator 3-like [Typha angustifolia]|uniref:calmodulin-binding transcription activator 3-like n=1 Tax=Typha angustifolia TaxID=59011 RepID=UPI003C2D571B